MIDERLWYAVAIAVAANLWFSGVDGMGMTAGVSGSHQTAQNIELLFRNLKRVNPREAEVLAVKIAAIVREPVRK